MYLSRNDIPSNARMPVEETLKAYHVASFKKDFLIDYANMSQIPLEKIEFNEYLRILENGYKIQGVLVDSDAISVDTQQDLDYVTEIMRQDIFFPLYHNKEL
jgi:3-deoxy-manno-octulosonate cytidylyltransferase (CMP-KDO synthetase)